MTQIGNRRKFYEEFLALDGEDPYSLVIIDLNNFKMLNDSLGHTRGDQVLHDFAHQLQAIAQQLNGNAYRLGGDEFIVLYPASQPAFDQWVDPLDQVLQAFHEKVTVSFGEIIVRAPQIIDQIYRDLCINRADDMLYQYKQVKKSDPPR